MSEYVIVRINEKLIPEFQINYNSNTKIATKREISVWSDIILGAQQKLILIVSASLVLTKEVTIPSKNEEIIRQSIPYALEEFLANDLDDNHFAYRHLSEQNFLVSVVQKSILKQIKTELENNDLECKQMLSEIFTLPFHKGKSSILSLKNQYIIREEYTGTVVSETMLNAYINSSNLDQQIFYSQQAMDCSKFPNSEIKIIDIPLLQAITVTSQDGINLFQGKFSQTDEKQQSQSTLKKILLLSAILVFSWISIHVYNLWNLSNQIDTLKRQQSQLLLALIPNASNTERRDPYSAVKSRLKISQTNKSSNSKIGFIQSLHYIGQTLLDHPSIEVQSLRYRDSNLEVSVHTQDMAKLNAFQSSLENNVLLMSVKTGTREVDNNGVKSVITMEALQ